MFGTKLFGEPCSKLLFDRFVRDDVSAVDIIHTLLNSSHKLNAISNLID